MEENETFTQILFIVLRFLIFAATVLYSIESAKRYRIERKAKLQEQAEESEIKGLGTANKLFKDGYYSHSILESYKVLETHLHKIITAKNIRVSKFRYSDLINISLIENIINNEDLKNIENLRKMRNISAHTDQIILNNKPKILWNL